MDGGGAISRTLGRVSSKTRTIDSRSYTTQYQYSTASQTTLAIYPSGKRVRINRDTRGRMSGLDGSKYFHSHLAIIGRRGERYSFAEVFCK